MASVSAVPLIVGALLLVNKLDVRATAGARESSVTRLVRAAELLPAASVTRALNV